MEQYRNNQIAGKKADNLRNIKPIRHDHLADFQFKHNPSWVEMFTKDALYHKSFVHTLCFVVHCSALQFYPYWPGFLHRHWGNLMVASVLVTQPWRIWKKKSTSFLLPYLPLLQVRLNSKWHSISYLLDGHGFWPVLDRWLVYCRQPLCETHAGQSVNPWTIPPQMTIIIKLWTQAAV